MSHDHKDKDHKHDEHKKDEHKDHKHDEHKKDEHKDHKHDEHKHDEHKKVEHHDHDKHDKKDKHDKHGDKHGDDHKHDGGHGLKIHGLGMSTCTRRVTTALHEAGVDYEMVVVDLTKGEHKQPAHLARNPFGQIPAFEDTDGSIVFESRAIMRYIAKRFPEHAKKIVPEDIKSYGMMETWLNAEQASYSDPISTIVYECMFKAMFHPGATPDQKSVDTNKEKLSKVVDILDKHLEHNHYFAGAHFSIADIAYMPYLDYLIKCGQGDFVLAKPHFAAWWKRVSTRESWKKATA